MGYVESAREQHIRGIRQGLHRFVGPDSYVSSWPMRPVILDVENQSWAEEATLVAEVNRRGYVNTFGDESIISHLVARLEEGETAVVIADHDSPLCNAPNAYAIRLDQMQPDFDSAGPLELARLLRVGEAPLIAVSGSVGGAGVSTLAFFLADALGAAGMDAVMLDAAPESTGVDVALGVERVEGTRIMGADLNPELKELPRWDSRGYLPKLVKAALPLTYRDTCGVWRSRRSSLIAGGPFLMKLQGGRTTFPMPMSSCVL